MPKIRNINSGAVTDVSRIPVFSEGIWDCGNQRFIDKSGNQYEIILDPAKVTVIAFKMLFSMPERVSISAAKSTDPIIADFYSLLDDPRTENVDMSFSAVQEMLDYLVSKSLLTSARKAQILSYVP